jgi:hypothetical protein
MKYKYLYSESINWVWFTCTKDGTEFRIHKSHQDLCIYKAQSNPIKFDNRNRRPFISSL